ncbi:hypothetical protein PhCBS80983_g01797 [Powellomyces hirtus]|uniref:Uncharacterized protein n=1 Tax=Powellomyces hirtus TaxID=109895 RepID=A0A507E990_9FUNG|nr:hypothetical protein PhCBS80983_g01797 [Powellomyces hirtus]
MSTAAGVSSSYVRGREDRLRALERERALFSKSARAPSSPSRRSFPSSPSRDVAAVRAAIFKTDATRPEERLHVNARTVRDLLDTDLRRAEPAEWRDYCCERPSESSSKRPVYGYAHLAGRAKSPGGVVRTPSSPCSQRHARTLSADAWRLNVNKEGSMHDVKQASVDRDNPLLSVLESERGRYYQLEKDYHKLLSEVQALQRSHRQELSDTERRRESHVRSLEKSIATKSEECLSMHREIQQLQSRHSKDVTTWNSTKSRHEAHVQSFEKLVAEAQHRERELNDAVKELMNAKNEISAQLAGKESEIRKLTQMFTDREEEYTVERKLRASLDEKLVLVEDLFSQREDELREVKQTIQKQQREYISESAKHRSAHENAQKEIRDLLERNQQQVRELEQRESNERKLTKQLADVSVFHMNAQQNIDQLTVRFSTQKEENARLIASEAALRRELEKAIAKHSRTLEELAKVESKVSKYQSEKLSLQGEVESQKSTAEQYRAQVDSLKREEQQLHSRIETGKREAEQLRGALKTGQQELVAQQERANRELKNAKSSIKRLQDQLNELTQKLTTQSAATAELKEANQARLLVVSGKIAGLQRSLSESQAQLDSFRAAEKQLRETVTVKDETIRGLTARIKDIENLVASLQMQLDRERRQVHDYKRQKKDEFLAINEKFLAAKAAMEHEGAALRSQLQQKAIRATELDARISQLTEDLADSDANRAALESRIYELTAQEDQHARNVSQLQTAVANKEHEKHLLHIQNLQLTDQNARMVKEINTYRSNAGIKDTEIDQLRQSVAELAAKLNAQVQSLLDLEASSGGDDDQILPPFPNPTRYGHPLYQHLHRNSSSDDGRQYDHILAALQQNVDEINQKLKPDILCMDSSSEDILDMSSNTPAPHFSAR